MTQGRDPRGNGTAGARSIATVPPDHLAALNAGTAQTRTLSEGLAMDFAAHMTATFPRVAAEGLTGGIVARMALAGRRLAEAGVDPATLAEHPSDTVRGWACYALAVPPMSLAARLAAIRPFADDAHFGVREWAWLAIRPHLAAELPAALDLLVDWTRDPSDRIRRFASESTRPRGVWCAHLAPLRADPAPGLALLEPLRADPVPYVQDSVANWLNDAAKDHPATIRALADRWRAQSPGPATARILKRGLRSV
jgi:3-methyladenine DNA glycosylase AlkC